MFKPIRRKTHSRRREAGTDFDDFVRAYLEAALFTAGLEKRGLAFTKAAVASAEIDAERFLEENAKIIEHAWPRRSDYPASVAAGHDFWLTRNREGAGFWDGDWDLVDPTAGKRLSDAAHRFREVSVEVRGGRVVFV